MRELFELVNWPDEFSADVEERFLRARAPLGPLLAARLRQGKWRIWSILPKGSYEAGMSLRSAYEPSPDDPLVLLSHWIEDFLRRRSGRTVIFENDPARKDNPWLQKCTAKTIFLNDRVYHYAGSDDSAAEIEAVIRYAGSASWTMGAVVDSSSSDLPKEITEDNLREFASKAVSLICDAFDGQSFVVAEMAGGPSIVPDHEQS
jgi:hypothetical protein